MTASRRGPGGNAIESINARHRRAVEARGHGRGPVGGQAGEQGETVGGGAGFGGVDREVLAGCAVDGELLEVQPDLADVGVVEVLVLLDAWTDLVAGPEGGEPVCR